MRSLNPCFNGRYSQSIAQLRDDENASVLILVLMEDTLRVYVLHQKCITTCLNPCFNGRFSQGGSDAVAEYKQAVLILVLMEDTLRVHCCQQVTHLRLS